jgi:SAM-dependent methyltransferase
VSMRNFIKRLLPAKLIQWRKAIHNVRPLYRRNCPICGYTGFFGFFGRPPRLDAECPRCLSLERHRLFWLWLSEYGRELSEPILHFAPEKILAKRFRELYKEYKTADLFSSADLKLNIEKINLPDKSIGTVICNHVLEHVNDARAISEIKRILKDDGLFIVSVPIVEGWDHSYENDAIRGPALREVHFGQSDHVRFYGKDFRYRLRAGGFLYDERTAGPEEAVRHGLVRGEKVFVCRKA